MTKKQREALVEIIAQVQGAVDGVYSSLVVTGRQGDPVADKDLFPGTERIAELHVSWVVASRELVKVIEAVIEDADREALGLPTGAEISDQILSEFVEAMRASAGTRRS
jgi:hypothetical protein